MNKKMRNQMLYPNTEDGIYRYEYVMINGIKQYIQVRGKDKKNPILLVLHGGPGGSLAGLAHVMQDKWEEQFVVVNWDQRNACKTYLANKERASEIAGTGTIKDYMGDITGIIEWLHTICDFEKVYLLGFSWGSIIGVEYAKKHPECIAGYVAVGQLVNFKEGLRFICDKLLAIANEMNKKRDIDLISTGLNNIPKDGKLTKEFMDSAQKILVLASRHLAKSGRPFPIKGLWGSPFLNLAEKKTLIFSDYNLFEGTWKTTLEYDFRQNMNFEVPVLFIYGEEDVSCPSELLQECFDEIKAPSKKLVVMKEASHMCFYDQPEKFWEIMKNIIYHL